MSTRTNLMLGVALLLIGLAGMALTTAITATTATRTSQIGGVFDNPGDVDAVFIEQMIPHHDDAVAMAELAIDVAKRPEIRQLATDIKRDQTAEIEQMREWYRSWYGRDVPAVDSGTDMMGRGMMGGGMMGDIVDLDDLAGAEDFDRMFIEQMIPHHRMGVMMANMAGANTRRPEIRTLTDSIARSQSAEIEQMSTWYHEWYR